MANEEVFDDDFYQEDFSTATEWEAFVSRLTDILESYEVVEEEPLSNNELSLCEWCEEEESIVFNDFNLSVIRYKAKIPPKQEASKSTQCQVFQDLISIKNDHCLLDFNYLRHDYEVLYAPKPAKIHPLAVWYGLRDFIVLKNKKPLHDLSKIKLLQSSMRISVFDSKCNIPTFIQALYHEQDLFLGIYEYKEFQLAFDIVHLKTPPPPCKYLSGLIEMFKGKIGMAYVNPVTVSVCLSYSLKNFLSAAYSSDKKSDNDEWDKIDFVNVVSNLSFGVSIDPVHELILYTKWPQVGENVVFDSETYSDFNPINAPKWSIRTRFDYTPVCYLADMLHDYLTLIESQEALSEYYNFLLSKNRAGDVGNPFAALTDSRIPSLPSVLNTGSYSIDGPINEDQMQQIFSYLFPENNAGKFSYGDIQDNQFDPQKIKSATPDSLVHRLSIILANIYTSFSGRRSVAQFWTEFTQKLRERVEKCLRIPGVASGFPDMRTCLLHQKLQMLNVCIERKNIREGRLPFAMQQQFAQQEGKTDSDDEFFDCDDDRVVDDEAAATQSPWNPVGRISKLGKMLLIDCDEPLYIPVTQDPVPKTEDELEDDAEMLLNVSDSELRAQLMSASLLSDMESFKAANPKGKLEDFIRWYSPRDWIEDEANEDELFGRKGHLSDRMMIPGNTWQTVWSSAKPVPARRQRRLFDDTKEMEKVLHFLECQTLGSIGELTIAPLFHSALIKLQKESEETKDFLPNFKEKENKLKQNCCILSREKWISSKNVSRKKWEAITNDFSEWELSINQGKSIMKKLYQEDYKLNDDDIKFLNSLMKCYDTELEGGAKNDIGVRVMSMFNEARAYQNEQRPEDHSWSLPDPFEKQFTLRQFGNTTNQGTGGPQFMRVILSGNEFRLCGAFSQNTTFVYAP
ncbi:CLUMA_CG017645, isoform A [Clunio marinus]|uniref:Rab3 GTPase-activating protein catalytic subunit n=1 Tax=Clunio marinus TaxID=568069 RepID=A0A1J1IWU8_9DIPT|nr:CLUMA_CG017645, isoform A [Clunio marinus]